MDIKKVTNQILHMRGKNYLKKNKNVKNSNLNPLVCYALYGIMKIENP
jgi:hypothetical protein